MQKTLYVSAHYAIEKRFVGLYKNMRVIYVVMHEI